jgi:hypothetical protein
MRPRKGVVKMQEKRLMELHHGDCEEDEEQQRMKVEIQIAGCHFIRLQVLKSQRTRLFTENLHLW